jgi:hypothetical protein
VCCVQFVHIDFHASLCIYIVAFRVALQFYRNVLVGRQCLGTRHKLCKTLETQDTDITNSAVSNKHNIMTDVVATTV